jgi:hypothetical protein
VAQLHTLNRRLAQQLIGRQKIGMRLVTLGTRLIAPHVLGNVIDTSDLVIV